MRPINVTVGPVGTVSATAVAASQTPGAAGNLTINGSDAANGVATLPSPQRVLITTSDTTHIFTVTGTTLSGAVVTETVGPITTSAYTAQDFATVTAVSINGAATGAVTVGTNGIAATPWVRLDEWAAAQVGIQCDVTGTVSFTVQSSYDDPNKGWAIVLPQNMVWINSSDTNAVNATANLQTQYAYAPTWVRALLNSGSGSVTMTVTQYSVAPY